MSADEHRSGALGKWGHSFTTAEGWSIALSVVSLVLVYLAVAPEVAGGKPERQYALLFLPHIVLIALVVGGMRRFAVVVQTFITLFAALVGLGMCVDAAMGNHELHGYGLIVALQLPLFVLCYRGAKSPFRYQDLSALGPRLMLGVFLAVIGWFAAGLAMHAAAAPARAREAAFAAGKRREATKREAYARANVLTACLQLSPASADSAPYFPATLQELPTATCPEAALPAPEGFVIEYVPGTPDSTGRRRSFHLSIHDSVSSDSLHSYLSGEAMIVQSVDGQGHGRNPVYVPDPMAFLSRVGRCIEQARDTLVPAYPASVVEAKRRRECEAPVAADSSAFRVRGSLASYVVHYAPVRGSVKGPPVGYTLVLEPERDSRGRGVGGSLISFFRDSTGLIHLTRRPRAATAADSVIPDCAGHDAPHYDSRTPCREYRPRQRWGLAGELPTIAMSMSGSGTLGIGEELSLLPHFQPLLPEDLPAEVRVRWDRGGRDTVLTKRRGVPFGTPIGTGVYFTFRHAWADTGMKRVEVRIRTVGGEEFQSQQDIHVVPVHR